MRRRKTLFPLTGLLLALLLATGGCAGSKARDTAGLNGRAPGAKIKVVATLYPLYEFTRQVGGETVEAVNLIPAGVEPHDWEPSPKDVKTIQQADILVYNGANLEPWIDRLLAAGTISDVRPDARPLLVRSTKALTLYAFKPDKTGGVVATPAATDGGEPQPDPHVWLDPVAAQQQVAAIVEALSAADPAHRADYAYRAARFIGALAELDKDYRNGLRDCDRRVVITSHAAFGYLAWRYGLTLIPITGVNPEAEPTPAEVARIAALAKQHRVRYIFTETLAVSKAAETIASEAGAQTLVLNPLEGLTKEEEKKGATYLTVMRNNLQSLRTALGCR